MWIRGPLHPTYCKGISSDIRHLFADYLLIILCHECHNHPCRIAPVSKDQRLWMLFSWISNSKSPPWSYLKKLWVIDWSYGKFMQFAILEFQILAEICTCCKRWDGLMFISTGSVQTHKAHRVLNTGSILLGESAKGWIWANVPLI